MDARIVWWRDISYPFSLEPRIGLPVTSRDVPPTVQRGVGQRFGLNATGFTKAPVEAVVDAAVIAWFPPYRREITAIRRRFEEGAQDDFADATASILAEDPGARDTLETAPWRNGLRALGIVAAALAVACVFVALGASPRNQPPTEASTVAVLLGVTAWTALATLGASLLFPRRMGVPNRLVSNTLWLATVGTVGSFAALPVRRETWTDATPWWWALAGAAGAILFALALVVAIWRSRHRGGVGPPTDESVQELRVSIIASRLEAAVTEVEIAWSRLDPEIQRALLHEREEAVATIEGRPGPAIDAAWITSRTPGVLGLPHCADKLHQRMHLGDAMLVDRSAPGRFGYFVGASRPAP